MTKPSLMARTLKIIGSRNGMLVAVLGSTALIVAGLVGFAPEPDQVEATEVVWPVTTAPVAIVDLEPEITLYGRVETPRTSTLTPVVGAVVEAVRVKEGERAEAGQILIQLETTDADLLVARRQADLVDAEAKLRSRIRSHEDDRTVLEHQRALTALADDRVARHEKLRRKSLIAEETLNAVKRERHQQAIALSRQENLVANFDNDLAQARARVDQAQTALTEARVQRERTEIRAPFAGRVTQVNVSPGEMVAPGVVVAEIYDDNDLELRVPIPNTHLKTLQGALARGETIRANAEVSGETIRAELVRLSGRVAAGQTGVDGLFRLERSVEADLGRALQVTLVMPTLDAVASIPVQSLYGHDRVFIVEDEHLKSVRVARLGEHTAVDGTLRIIVQSEELEPGRPILTSQLTNAVTGLPVSISNPGERQLAADSARRANARAVSVDSDKLEG